MRVQGESLTRRAAARDRRLPVDGAAGVGSGGSGAGRGAALRSGSALRPTATRLARVGRDAANDRFQRQPGFIAGAGAEPEVEMGVRLRRRERRGRQPDHRRRPRVRRQRIGPGVRARPEGRLRALDVQGRRRRARRGRRRRRAGTASTAAYFGDIRAIVYSVDATTGELRWKKQVDEHRAARITGSPVLLRRRLYVPVSSVEEAHRRAAVVRMLHVPRQHRRARSGHRRRVWRTYMIAETPSRARQERQGRAAVGPVGRRGVVGADDDARDQVALCRDRRRLLDARRADDRRDRRARSRDRRDQWAQQVDRRRCVHDGVRDRRHDQLSGESRPGSRLRPVADPRARSPTANG